MSASKDQILAALRRVKGPDLESNIVDLGLVSEILLKDGRAYFSITVPRERAASFGPGEQVAVVVGVAKGVDDSQHRGALTDQGDADRATPPALQIGRGTVVRIDQPDVLGVGGIGPSGFLAVIGSGKGSQDLLADAPLRLLINVRVASAAARTARAVELGSQKLARL